MPAVRLAPLVAAILFMPWAFAEPAPSGLSSANGPPSLVLVCDAENDLCRGLAAAGEAEYRGLRVGRYHQTGSFEFPHKNMFPIDFS